MELEAEVAKLKEENELLQKKQVRHCVILSANNVYVDLEN